jgi:hypothetical protein
MAIIRNDSQIAGITLSASGNAAGVVMQHKTDSEMNAISSPTAGDVIFNTGDNQYYTYSGNAWASAKGAAGTAGAGGAAGGDGDRGAKGPKGTAGAQGYQGVTGDANNTTGATGDTGPKGAKGPAGYQGYMGHSGALGGTGSRGSRSGAQPGAGPTGATGYQGNTNTQTGAGGPQGPKGPKGTAGYTGYMGHSGGLGGTGSRGSRSGGKGPTGYQGNTGGASTNQTMNTGNNVQLLQLGIGTGSIPGRMRIARMVTDAVIFTNGAPEGFRTVGGGNTGQVYRAHNYGGTDRHFVSRNGQWYHSGNRTSDQRLKKDIEEYSGSVLSNIDQFQPKQFFWKPDEENTNRKLGFIAQDYTASKFSELITGEDNLGDVITSATGNKYSGSFGFNYDGATSLLIKAVSESMQLISNLKTKLTALESA